MGRKSFTRMGSRLWSTIARTIVIYSSSLPAGRHGENSSSSREESDDRSINFRLAITLARTISYYYNF